MQPHCLLVVVECALWNQARAVGKTTVALAPNGRHSRTFPYRGDAVGISTLQWNGPLPATQGCPAAGHPNRTSSAHGPANMHRVGGTRNVDIHSSKIQMHEASYRNTPTQLSIAMMTCIFSMHMRTCSKDQLHDTRFNAEATGCSELGPSHCWTHSLCFV